METTEEIDYAEPQTPPEIAEASEAVLGAIVPKKSEYIYEKSYTKFMAWREEKKAISFSKRTILAYFKELSLKYKTSTLWSEHSKLKTCLLKYHKINIGDYTELKPFFHNLKKNKNEDTKKPKSFTKEEIEKFLNEAPDEQWLDVKVVMIFGFHGYCRRQELHGLLMSDMKIYYEKDDNQKKNPILELSIPRDRIKNYIDRKFVIRGEFYKIYEKYATIRDKIALDNRFFYRYMNGKCKRQVIGVNSIGSMPKRIATYSKLANPEQYTGHAFRHTAASSFMEGGGDEENLMIAGGWKSRTAAQGYVRVAHRTLEKHNEFSTAAINIQVDANKQKSPMATPTATESAVSAPSTANQYTCSSTITSAVPPTGHR